ncbi:MAG: peroxide stress protein YaaA [Bacteroidetes bacterium]|nr:MAG: peroxide stress protein YaaA [Bacteroidota bacterium]
MLLIISPAKKLDLSEESRYTSVFTQPLFQEDTQMLAQELAQLSPAEIGKLMDLSPALSELNYERYQQLSFPFTPENAKQALLSFKGDVYLSLTLAAYTEEDFAFAQRHLRILSGLYGLLRPLDLMQAYRLEMGTAFKNARGKNLYEFWGERISLALNDAIAESGSEVLVNLASEEYFKSVKTASIRGQILTPVFKEERKGKLQSIFLYAKQARGAMSDYVIRERIVDVEGLKAFTGMGYRFREDVSTETEWVFSRA